MVLECFGMLIPCLSVPDFRLLVRQWLLPWLVGESSRGSSHGFPTFPNALPKVKKQVMDKETQKKVTVKAHWEAWLSSSKAATRRKQCPKSLVVYGHTGLHTYIPYVRKKYRDLTTSSAKITVSRENMGESSPKWIQMALNPVSDRNHNRLHIQNSLKNVEVQNGQMNWNSTGKFWIRGILALAVLLSTHCHVCRTNVFGLAAISC